MRVFLEVDPRELHLPPTRAGGADPVKLQRQIAKFGNSVAGMPAIWVYRGTDGGLMIFDGVTRASRVAQLQPGLAVKVEVVGDLPSPCSQFPTIGELLS